MNVLRYSYESKLASAAVVAMLALSGIFAAFLIIPRVTAASGPSITLTPASGTVGTTVTVFGTGFAPNSDITLTMTNGFSSPTTLVTFANSLIDTNTHQLMTDADGNFEAQFTVPTAVGGPQTVTATDAKGNSATATFTVKPSFTLFNPAGANFTGAFPDQNIGCASPDKLTGVLKGFGKNELVSLNLLPITTSSVITTPFGDYSFCINLPSFSVPLVPGGTYTFTATGTTSGFRATAKFTVKSAIAFYSSQTSFTVFSVNPSQYSVFYLQGFGFPSGTIPANSITINGQTVQNPAITVDNTGTFGLNPGSRIPVSFPVGLVQGPASITIGGQTFDYAHGNIVCATNIPACPNTFTAHNYVGIGWGGPLILSVGKGLSSIVLDSTSYVPDGSTPITVFGFGTWGTVLTLYCNALHCGGFSISYTDSATDAWYAVTAPFGPAAGFDTNGNPLTYTVTASDGTNTATATFGITQAVEANSCLADYRTNVGSACSVKAYGFAQSETVNLYVGSKFIGTGTADSTGFVSTFSTPTPINILPGTYAFKAVGVASAASAVTSPLVTYTPAVYQPTGRPGDLTVDSGPAGTSTVLVSGTDYGVHGLNASTTYQLAWGIGPNAQVITTFTTDTNGMIPGAGVQFTVPAGTTGVHILSIRNSAGKDVIFGNVAAGDTPNAAPGSAGGTIYAGQYGDLLFALSANIQLSPTGGGVGTVVTVSGTALTAGTTYYVWLAGEGVYRATFTATSTGSVPAGVNFTFPAKPTAAGGENGTAYPVCVGTSSQFQSGTCANFAFFALHATASLNATTASPGQAVTVSALGLVAGAPYTVVFNKQVVTTFFANAVGSGSATFTVPTGTAPGAYQVKIFEGYGQNKGALLTPPTLTVTSGAVVTTQSLTPGTPTQTTLNGQPAVSLGYTNTLSVTVTAVVYAVVTNSAGQVVYYTTATITVSPGSSQTAYAVLAGLPHGTYTVTLFAIVNNQVASTTTTTQVTI